MRRLSFIITPLLFLEAAAAPAAQVSALNIVVVEGEGAINNIRQRTAREPIVQVEDQNRRPVAGAAVVFLLPEQGASGVFANGSRTLTVMTDNQGRAVARGMRPNNLQGRVEIRVTASHQGQSASAVITQTNVGVAAAAAAGAGFGLKWLAIIAIAGAAAAGGIVAGTRGGDNGAPVRPATTITPGGSTVGPPR